MKTSFRILICAGLLAAFAALASAENINGILIDKMCSAKALSGGQKAATEHTRECALMPNCQKSGFGVFTSDGKYLTFDEEGNSKALTALNASKKKDNLNVRVTGQVQGDTIKVTNIKLL